MDNLENFIRSNREDFDMSSPDLKVWANIDRDLEPRRSRRLPLWRNLVIAASVLFLIGIGTMIGLQINHGADAYRTLSDVSLEHQELEQYYENQLREKTALLASYGNSDHSVDEDLFQLEGFLNELQDELQEAPKGSEEQIINAMIENYQDRLEILERVLSRIKTQSNKKEKVTNNEELTL